jgi:CheY-like chemotaxis protein
MRALILAVEDEPDVSELFRQQLRRDARANRFALDFALSGEEALGMVARESDADLILILPDINMPGMSGLDMLPMAREARPDVHIIMITAYGDAEARRNAQCGWLIRQADRLPRTSARHRGAADGDRRGGKKPNAALREFVGEIE